MSRAKTTFEPPAGFRRTPTIELWSRRILPNVSFQEFESRVTDVAAHNKNRYTGFITTAEAGIVTSFTRTRYPRRKYGVASITDCENGMQELADDFGTALRPDLQRTGFRVVLGLIEGYDTMNPQHMIEEVRATLGPDFGVSAAAVFAVRFGEDVSVYTEPVAVIRGSLGALAVVNRLADSFKQERYTIEDFEAMQAYAIETPHCTEPD